MEQMTEALEYANDSNGEISGTVLAALEIIHSIAKEQIPEEIRELIIDYCIDSFDKEVFSGWDWHTDVLHLASLLVKTEDETERIFKLIDRAHS